MGRTRIVVSVVLLFILANVSPAGGAEAEQANSTGNIRQRETLANGGSLSKSTASEWRV